MTTASLHRGQAYWTVSPHRPTIKDVQFSHTQRLAEELLGMFCLLGEVDCYLWYCISEWLSS